MSTPRHPSDAVRLRCQGCGHCCHHYLVSLNAHEVDRLTAATARPVETFATTRAGLVVLRQDADTGRCNFRTDGGCAVYADRPLACRLYPLRRSVDAEAVGRWAIPAPRPDSHGTYRGQGSICVYIGDADTARSMRAADRAA